MTPCLVFIVEFKQAGHPLNSFANIYRYMSDNLYSIFAFCYIYIRILLFYIVFLLFLYCISALKCLYMPFRVGYILKKALFLYAL